MRNMDCGVLETTDWGEVTMEIDWFEVADVDTEVVDEFEDGVVMAAAPLFVLLEMAVKVTLLEVEAVAFDAAILEPIRVGVLKVCEDIELSDRSDDTLAELEFARGVELVTEELVNDVVFAGGINNGNGEVAVEIVTCVETLANDDISDELS